MKMPENNGANCDSLDVPQQNPNKITEFNKMDTIDKQWLQLNKDTFICFSCSEGLFLWKYNLILNNTYIQVIKPFMTKKLASLFSDKP
jgi:hypothetical protein